MTTRVSRGRICLTSFNSTIAKTPYYRLNYLSDISHISWFIAHFVSNVVAMAIRVGRGEICVTSFNSPNPKTPCWTQNLLDISYTSRVITDFVSNFVAMATGVDRGKICLASFNSATLKTPCYTQRSRGYLLYRPSYSRFCPKFRCHGNGGWSQ